MVRQITRFWRILREINVEAIRRQAEASFPVLVVADDPRDRRSVAALLNEDGAADASNPWLRLAGPGEVQGEISNSAPGLALLVSRDSDVRGALESARSFLSDRRVPVVTLLVGGHGFLDTFARRGEMKRVAVNTLDESERSTIAEALFDAVPSDTRLALARQFQGLRPQLFNDLVQETSRANASYAFSTGLAEIVPFLDVPLNVGDIFVLTKNQLVMAYRIALAAGKQGKPRDVIGELVGVLGGGLLFRQIARELIGLVPVVGVVPKVIVAYTGTWAIGHAVVAWASGGERLSKQSLEHLYTAGLERGREIARQLTSRPSHAA